MLARCAFNSAGGELTIPDEFAQGGVYASLYPAVWSFMLALRARGLGSSLTTLHVLAVDEVAEVIDMPSYVTLGRLIPVAYFTGADFRPGIRRPAEEVTYWDVWGSTRQVGENRCSGGRPRDVRLAAAASRCRSGEAVGLVV